ncbi:MAG: lysylphosphatidylglycerol synthase transmembrane domain-containing protein [Bdellovibrionota bacterium]
MDQTKSYRKHLSTLIKILIAAGIIYWLVQSGKLNFSALKSMLSPVPFILGTVLLGLSFIFATLRWGVLLKTQNIEARTWPLLKLTLIGTFFNYAMPGGVGGDLVKAFYFYKEQTDSKVAAISSVAVDRILGLYTMVLMALVVMIYDFQHIQSSVILHKLFFIFCLIFFVFTLTLFLLFTRKYFFQSKIQKILELLPKKEKFIKLYTSTQLYGSSPWRLLQVVGYSLIAQIAGIFFLILAGQVSGLAENAKWSTYFLVAPLGFMATAVPISPAGIGVGQAAFYFLFNNYLGYKSELGPTIITAMQIFQMSFGLIGAFFYLQRKEKSVQVLDMT